MRKILLTALLLPLHCWSSGFVEPDAPPSIAPCVGDVRAIFEYLKTNDAGVSSRLGDDPHAFDQAFEKSVAAALHARGESECLGILDSSLKNIRKSHLQLETARAIATAETESQPSITYPSAHWAWLSMPSFDAGQGERIRKLINSEKGALERRRNWIIDVRGNAGAPIGHGNRCSMPCESVITSAIPPHICQHLPISPRVKR